jgi:hypothetical protein
MTISESDLKEKMTRIVSGEQGPSGLTYDEAVVMFKTIDNIVENKDTNQRYKKNPKDKYMIR